MARFEISISPEYVPTWGIQEAVREILQNAKDEEEADSRHPMRVRYSTSGGGRLQITSEGVALDRAVLLLGKTTKTGTGARGKFGEGLDLALLAALRAGHAIRIENGDESWIPAIEWSEIWGHDVLVVSTRSLGTHRHHLRVEIDGVTHETWTEIQRRCLFVGRRPANGIDVAGYGTVFPDLPGDIYAKGLWVGRIPGLIAGYDLRNVNVDRDRRIVDPWSLRWALGRLYSVAIKVAGPQRDLARQMIARGSEDVAGMADILQSETGSEVDAIADDFRDQHGQNAVPVTTTSDADRASAAGLTPVMVPATTAAIILTAGRRPFDEIISEAHAAAIVPISPDDLRARDLYPRYETIRALSARIAPDTALSIADLGPDVLGQASATGIILAAAVIAGPPGPAITTLAHEAAHIAGDGAASDMTLAHHVQEEHVIEKIIEMLLTDGSLRRQIQAAWGLSD